LFSLVVIGTRGNSSLKKMTMGLVIAVTLLSPYVVAETPKPTCEEEPSRRDCVKVEDPNASPPKQTVNQNKPERLPVAKPAPAPYSGVKSGGAGH
jgi:hypothetical protein